MRNKALAAAALVAAGLAVAATGSQFYRPSPAGPPPPPPVISGPSPEDGGFSARLLGADALPSGARPVPLQADGRLIWMQPGKSLRHHWPGLAIHGNFTGTGAYLLFDDAVNRFRLTLDGNAKSALTITRPGRRLIELAGLPPGPHSLTIEKLSESPQAAGFGGIWAKPGGEALAPPPARQPLIEIIGDSDSIGYGNSAPGRDCTADQVFLATDATQAFPALVAAELGAASRVIARSGIGIVRNYEGAAPGETMLDFYPLDQPATDALPAQTETPADLIILALGSNDFSTPLAKGESWNGMPDLEFDAATGLAELAATAQLRNPGAALLLLAFGEYGDSLMEAHRQAMAQIKPATPDARLIVLPELERTACHWHPSLADHRKIADHVLEAIAALPRHWKD